MKEQPRIEYRGFGFGQVFLAALTGAAAGAAFAYLTAPASGEDSRRRLREAAAGTKQGVERVPEALARATEAARQAFLEAIDGHQPSARG
jgi:gas vesicle protein